MVVICKIEMQQTSLMRSKVGVWGPSAMFAWVRVQHYCGMVWFDMALWFRVHATLSIAVQCSIVWQVWGPGTTHGSVSTNMNPSYCIDIALPNGALQSTVFHYCILLYSMYEVLRCKVEAQRNVGINMNPSYCIDITLPNNSLQCAVLHCIAHMKYCAAKLQCTVLHCRTVFCGKVWARRNICSMGQLTLIRTLHIALICCNGKH